VYRLIFLETPREILREQVPRKEFFCVRVDECGRKIDDCECKIGQIKTTNSLPAQLIIEQENLKTNLDFLSKNEDLKKLC